MFNFTSCSLMFCPDISMGLSIKYVLMHWQHPLSCQSNSWSLVDLIYVDLSHKGKYWERLSVITSSCIWCDSITYHIAQIPAKWSGISCPNHKLSSRSSFIYLSQLWDQVSTFSTQFWDFVTVCDFAHTPWTWAENDPVHANSPILWSNRLQ